MSRRALFGILARAAPLLIMLGGCSLAAPDGTGEITITASSGILTPSTPGTWVFDAGYVATNTIDSVTFTVKNTTSQDFSATSSAYSNSDFSDSLQGSFSVPAGQSASFTGFFMPTYNPGSQETDTLTLTPSIGSPMVLQLQGTSGAPSFLQVLDGNQNPVTSAAGTIWWGTNSLGIVNLTGRLEPSHTITLMGNPLVRVSNTADFTVDTSATSTSIPSSGSTAFGMDSLNSGGATTTVTIGGEDTIAGAFYFTFTIAGMGS